MLIHVTSAVNTSAKKSKWTPLLCSGLAIRRLATGNLVGAYFDWQETLTLKAYYHVYEQILVNYGIPLRFKTDNRTVFNYETAKTKAEHKDVLTQFGYACKTLGTDIVTTSVSQAKGMVERANQTVQSR